MVDDAIQRRLFDISNAFSELGDFQSKFKMAEDNKVDADQIDGLRTRVLGIRNRCLGLQSDVDQFTRIFELVLDDDNQDGAGSVDKQTLDKAADQMKDSIVYGLLMFMKPVNENTTGFMKYVNDALYSYKHSIVDRCIKGVSSSFCGFASGMSNKIKRDVKLNVQKILGTTDDFMTNIVVEQILNSEDGQKVSDLMQEVVDSISEIVLKSSSKYDELGQQMVQMGNQVLTNISDSQMDCNKRSLLSAYSMGNVPAQNVVEREFGGEVNGWIKDNMKSKLPLHTSNVEMCRAGLNTINQLCVFAMEAVIALMENALCVGQSIVEKSQIVSANMFQASSLIGKRMMDFIGTQVAECTSKEEMYNLASFADSGVDADDLDEMIKRKMESISQQLVDVGFQQSNTILGSSASQSGFVMSTSLKRAEEIVDLTEKVVDAICGGYAVDFENWGKSEGNSSEQPVLMARNMDATDRISLDAASRKYGFPNDNWHDFDGSKWLEFSQKMQKSQNFDEQYVGFLVELAAAGKTPKSIENAQSAMVEHFNLDFPDELRMQARANSADIMSSYDYVKTNEPDALNINSSFWNNVITGFENYWDDEHGGLPDNYKTVINAIKKAQQTNKSEDIINAAKLYYEGCIDNTLMQTSFHNDPLAAAALAYKYGYDIKNSDGDSFSASKTTIYPESNINASFWTNVLNKEGKDSEIGKKILKARQTLDPDDIFDAALATKKKYGINSITGIVANELAVYNMSTGYSQQTLSNKDLAELEYNRKHKQWTESGGGRYLDSELEDYVKKHPEWKISMKDMLDTGYLDDETKKLYSQYSESKDSETKKKILVNVLKAQRGGMLNGVLRESIEYQLSKLGVSPARIDYLVDGGTFDSEFWAEWESDYWKRWHKAHSATDSSLSSPESSNVPKFGWKGYLTTFVTEGWKIFMQEGDQQLFNPYGHPTGAWTMYSFRPCDTLTEDVNKNYPMIAITPSSFQSLKSINTMLDNIPYVVIREYFFKNQAQNVINFITAILQQSKETFDSLKNATDGNTVSKLKSAAENFTKKIQNTFKDISLKKAVIDIPYMLYCQLRGKQFGNTYIFPYIADSSTVINQASNASEWNGDSPGVFQTIKNVMQGISQAAGGAAMSIIGSQAMPATLFPVPTWSNKSTEKAEFQFDLILINDHIVKARNNYMCVNTIIHNNRWVQKSILAYPGALYELWLPTGQRHLMCTGEFTLYPLGLNRKVPHGFFTGKTGETGAYFKIGTTKAANMEQEHQDEVEVVPDAYKLNMKFQSCLANNMNTAVFQYYVKMTPYSDYAKENTEGEGDNMKITNRPGETSEQSSADVQSMMNSAFGSNASKLSTAGSNLLTINTPSEAAELGTGGTGEGQTPGTTPASATATNGATKSVRGLTYQSRDGESQEEYVEKFDESTFNKKLQPIKTSQGEMKLDADDVVSEIRQAQGLIRQTSRFLSKIYNAENNNLWWKPFEKDELLMTITPDARELLRKKYGEKFILLKQSEVKVANAKGTLDAIVKHLSTIPDLSGRDEFLEQKVAATRELMNIQQKRDALVDEIIQIDTDLIRAAFDQHDSVVSVKKNKITVPILQQVWNEKIMNSYERDKLQYMTSSERDRYFKEKIKEISKFDEHGILKRKDWFFRVVVMDFIVNEMKDLVSLFKQCNYADYDTVYRIIRKLRLLNLDFDQAIDSDDFKINKTNLFVLNDDEVQDFTKLDSILTGNTLYQLFQAQLTFDDVKGDSTEQSGQEDGQQEQDKELIQEQQSEESLIQQRNVRQDVVVRYWGSESALTKAAYDRINGGSSIDAGRTITVTFDDGMAHTYTLSELKNEIIELKINLHVGTSEEQNEKESKLRNLLGAFTSCVNTIKELMVTKKMQSMNQSAEDEIKAKDDTTNAKVMEFDET